MGSPPSPVTTPRTRAVSPLDELETVVLLQLNAPLSVRFRRTVKRMEAGVLDDETADRYGELTLAVHDLNVLLAQAFYPGR